MDFDTSGLPDAYDAVIQEYGVFREEFSGFPALTYFDNGLILAEWSHNQGKAGDKELADITSEWGAFPDNIDADGDGYIYFLLPSDWEGQYNRADIVDDSDYENWRNHYLDGAETLEIPYRELEVETVLPDAAG